MANFGPSWLLMPIFSFYGGYGMRHCPPARLRSSGRPRVNGTAFLEDRVVLILSRLPSAFVIAGNIRVTNSRTSPTLAH